MFKSFLENSSIHGLGFIARNKAFAQVFWVTVVISGFSVASQIIMLSFENWAANPVTTTMETLPIAEAPFPRVTVCPPKNTFTNLNYDLVFASNISISKDKRNSFIQKLFLRALDYEYKEASKLYLEESNRFRHWYNGFTMNNHPFDSTFRQTINTSSLSGAVSTPLFSKRFDISAFQNPLERSFEYDIEIDISPLSEVIGPLFLNLEIESDLWEGLEKVLVCRQKISFPWKRRHWIDSNCTGTQKKCVPCPYGRPKQDKYLVTFIRQHVNEEDLNERQLFNRSMTGLRVSWNVSSTSATANFSNIVPTFQSENTEFRDFAEVIAQFSGSEDHLWEIIKGIKIHHTKEHIRNLKKLELNQILGEIKENITKQSSSSVHDGELSNELLNMAGEMFIYIQTFPRDEWIKVLKNMKNIMDDGISPKDMLLSLSLDYELEGFSGENIKRIMFETLAGFDSFLFDQIDDMLSLTGDTQNNPELKIKGKNYILS